jgi:hypothetical protein
MVDQLDKRWVADRRYDVISRAGGHSIGLRTVEKFNFFLERSKIIDSTLHHYTRLLLFRIFRLRIISA